MSSPEFPRRSRNLITTPPHHATVGDRPIQACRHPPLQNDKCRAIYAPQITEASEIQRYWYQLFQQVSLAVRLFQRARQLKFNIDINSVQSAVASHFSDSSLTNPCYIATRQYSPVFTPER